MVNPKLDKFYFEYIDNLLSLSVDIEDKSKFLKSHLKRNYNIDDIDDESTITLKKVRIKTFFHLLLGLLLEYDDQNKSNKDDQTIIFKDINLES